jgi:hypothetical protein
MGEFEGVTSYLEQLRDEFENKEPIVFFDEQNLSETLNALNNIDSTTSNGLLTMEDENSQTVYHIIEGGDSNLTPEQLNQIGKAMAETGIPNKQISIRKTI